MIVQLQVLVFFQTACLWNFSKFTSTEAFAKSQLVGLVFLKIDQSTQVLFPYAETSKIHSNTKSK